MKFSVQSSDGEVFGVGELPESSMTPHEWQSTLEVDLRDITGRLGVRSTPLHMAGIKEPVDRLIIDIEPSSDTTTQARLDRIDETISRIALSHPKS